MNKSFLTMLLVSVLVLVSCQEQKAESAPEVSGLISVSPVACVTTKAPVDGKAFPDGRTFIMSASVNGSSDNYFKDAVFVKNGSVWSSDKYWPATDMLDFLAVSFDTLSVEGLSYASCVSDSLSVSVPDNSISQCDILHASAKGQSHSEGCMPMMFRHAGSVVIFTAYSTVPYDSVRNLGITIRKIILKEAWHSGTLKVRAVSDISDWCTWSSFGSKKDVCLLDADGRDSLAYDVPATPMDITKDGKHFGIGGRGILVPEQPQTAFVVEYTVHNGFVGGTRSDVDMDYSYACSGSWNEGKKYKYILKFNLKDITVIPTVEEWSLEEEEISIPEPIAATYSVDNQFSVSLPVGVMAASSVISVDWGDGSLELFSNATKVAGDTLRLSHTYLSAFTGKVNINTRKGVLDFGKVEEGEYDKFVISDVAKVKIRAMVHPGPNCFIVVPSTPFSFSPKNANVFWDDYGYENTSANVIGNNDIWTAEVLWADFDTSKMVMTKASGTGINDVCTVSFTDATVRGNAVVEIKKGSTVVWSYHLWITKYDPETSAVTFSGDTITWMSRNVGAMTDSYEEAHCLMYQFGRKDPFPYDKVTSGTAITTVAYHATGMPNRNNVPYSVSNPGTFITNGSYWTANDKYNPSACDVSLLWQDPTTKTGGSRTGEKSLFDPCPEGWRMPTNAQLSTLVSRGRVYNSSDKGSFVPKKDVSPRLFIPLSGWRYDDGSVGVRGSYGVCWSDVPNSSSRGFDLYSSSSKFSVSNGTHSFGFSVRCIKDN